MAVFVNDAMSVTLSQNRFQEAEGNLAKTCRPPNRGHKTLPMASAPLEELRVVTLSLTLDEAALLVVTILPIYFLLATLFSCLSRCCSGGQTSKAAQPATPRGLAPPSPPLADEAATPSSRQSFESEMARLHKRLDTTDAKLDAVLRALSAGGGGSGRLAGGFSDSAKGRVPSQLPPVSRTTNASSPPPPPTAKAGCSSVRPTLKQLPNGEDATTDSPSDPEPLKGPRGPSPSRMPPAVTRSSSDNLDRRRSPGGRAPPSLRNADMRVNSARSVRPPFIGSPLGGGKSPKAALGASSARGTRNAAPVQDV